MKSHTDNLFSLLAGAAIGAVAMYILDPEEGERRREQVGGFTSDALHGARDQWHTLAAKAQDLAGQVAQHASAAADSAQAGAAQYGRQASDAAHDYLSQAQKAYRQASGNVSDAADSASHNASSLADQIAAASHRLLGSARDTASDWRNRGNRASAALQGEEPSVALPVASAALGCLAIGAGAMWLFDAEHGPQRRAMLSEKCSEMLTETGKTFNLTGRYLRDQWSGISHQAEAGWEQAKSRVGDAVSSVSQSVTQSTSQSMPSSPGAEQPQMQD